jgi:hypothetical protein
MKRYHSLADQRIRHRRQKVARIWIGGDARHRNWRNRHPIDCGRRCYLCHGEKLLKIRSIAQQRADERERQMRIDVWATEGLP